MTLPPGIHVGAILVAFGLLRAAFPYGVARVGEQIDAIGSNRSAGSVAPADWTVLVTRLGGGAVVLGVTFGINGLWKLL